MTPEIGSVDSVTRENSHSVSMFFFVIKSSKCLLPMIQISLLLVYSSDLCDTPQQLFVTPQISQIDHLIIALHYSKNIH